MTFGFVYILASASGVLYIGVTSDLTSRTLEHRGKRYESFTKKYHVNKLVYWERHPNIIRAIAREKQLKGWLRKKKVALIESQNPKWRDLADDVFHPIAAAKREQNRREVLRSAQDDVALKAEPRSAKSKATSRATSTSTPKRGPSLRSG